MEQSVRLLVAILAFVLGFPVAMAGGIPISDQNPLPPEVEQKIVRASPAEQRQALSYFLRVFDLIVENLSDAIDGYDHLPDRGVGIQIMTIDISEKEDSRRIVPLITGAIAQTSVVEQLCPKDVIRAIDGVRIDPLEIVEEAASFEKVSAYLDFVVGLIRNAKGMRIEIAVLREGKVVTLSPKTDLYAKHRESMRNRVAYVRVLIARESELVDRLRHIAVDGPDNEILPAIKTVVMSIARTGDPTRPSILPVFGDLPLCPNE